MNRHSQSKTDVEETRDTQRDEWARGADASHQFEAREHARVSSKRQVLRSALKREHQRQISEVRGR